MRPFGQVDEIGPVDRVDGDEDRVPAAGPAVRGDRALDVGEPLGRLRPVGLGDGAEELGVERLRRELANLLDRLRIGPCASGERIPQADDPRRGQDRRRVRDRLRADVSDAAVADPVDGAQRDDVAQARAVLAVAEAEDGPALVVDLGDEVAVGGRALEQAGDRLPRIDVDRRRHEQRHRRLHVRARRRRARCGR